MLHPPAHNLPSPTVVVRGLPSLGILLAVAGLVLLGGAETGMLWPMFSAPRMVRRPLADVATTTTDTLSQPTGSKVRGWAADRRQPAAVGAGNRWRSEAASFRLTVQLTRGDRGESTNLAAMPLPSDLRQALLRMATAQHVRGRTGSSPASSCGAMVSLDGITSEDRIAIALYGPDE